jgi:hypothetical protein
MKKRERRIYDQNIHVDEDKIDLVELNRQLLVEAFDFIEQGAPHHRARRGQSAAVADDCHLLFQPARATSPKVVSRIPCEAIASRTRALVRTSVSRCEDGAGGVPPISIAG